MLTVFTDKTCALAELLDLFVHFGRIRWFQRFELCFGYLLDLAELILLPKAGNNLVVTVAACWGGGVHPDRPTVDVAKRRERSSNWGG